MIIVVDIPDDEYYAIIEHGMIGVCACKQSLANAIKEGIVLPKEHGRLIDADALEYDCNPQTVYYDDDEHEEFCGVSITAIETATTIIERR